MWSVKPLEGKYYGTIVQYDGCDVCRFWESNHFARPFGSSREIANGWTEEDGHDHVEDEQSLSLATEFVNHMNAINFKIKS